MCGFIGFTTSADSGVPAPSDRLQRGLRWIRRRGPDSQRTWHSADGRVHLGFARLAIVDQDEAAHQPLEASEAGVTVVLNGEIYNYDELRRRLADYPFRTRSDTEVLAAAFARWGIAGLRQLRGMFACAVVDARARRIYLARDAVGKKPLFVLAAPDGVLFGSSVLSLVAACDRPCALNDEAVRGFWRRDWVSPDDSIVQSCRPVLPGQVLELDWDGQRLREHSCRPSGSPVEVADAREAAEVCGQLIRHAIRRRLHNNPRPVSLLSGGIDSTVVTRAMFDEAGGEALTMASRLRLVPDERYARYAARRIGVPLEAVRIGVGSLAESVEWSLSLQDEPLAMISFFMLSQLVKAAKEHGRILLTGDGGDEVFLGYGAATDWQGASERDAAEAADRWTVGVPPPPWMSTWARFIVREQLLGHMFTKVDRAASEQGIEVRCPLLDWDLMAFARTLPPEWLFDGGRMKALLKAQLAGWPDGFQERTKVGFTFRLRWLWLLRGFAGLRDLVEPEAMETFGEAVPAALRTPARQWSARAIFGNFKAAWKLLVWSAFLRRFADASADAFGSEATCEARVV